MDPDPDTGSGSCYFRQWPSRCQQKSNLKKILLITFWRYIYIIFKDKKVKKDTKQKESRFFLLFLHDDRRIRIQEAHQTHTDPDPQQWLRWAILCCSGTYRSCYVVSFQYYSTKNHFLVLPQAMRVLFCSVAGLSFYFCDISTGKEKSYRCEE